MQETITHPKREISKYAPIFETIKIQKDDIKQNNRSRGKDNKRHMWDFTT